MAENGLLSAVKPADIEAYRRDGVVCLRGLFEPHWLEVVGRGIEKDFANPSPRFEARTFAGSAGDGAAARYCEDFWVWSVFPEFEDFVRNSPAAAIAAALLGARRVNLVMDNWFVREAGALGRAPWHHDIAYFDFEGTMCVLWLPLEASNRDQGIAFVRGSHLWDRLFMRVLFKDHRPDGAAGEVRGRRYELPPDIDAARSQYDIVSFDMAPGDCLVFDIRTLHGAASVAPPEKTVRRYSLRLAAEDGRIRYRGDWARRERAIFEQAGHGEGDALDSAFFPRLWTAG